MYSASVLAYRDDVEAESAAPAAAAGTFEELYAQLGPAIYARCRRILRDGAAAEDATQEVFLRIHERLHQMSGRGAALAWLYRTATNHCLNEIRNGRTHALLIGAALARPSPNAEHQLSERDLAVRLLRALPEELTLAAWLYHVDGVEQAEIAEICGVTRRTVISRLARFTERARELLQESDLAR